VPDLFFPPPSSDFFCRTPGLSCRRLPRLRSQLKFLALRSLVLAQLGLAAAGGSIALVFEFFSAVASGGVFADQCVEASVVIIVVLNLLACVASVFPA
jgi:hypothetical protein